MKNEQYLILVTNKFTYKASNVCVAFVEKKNLLNVFNVYSMFILYKTLRFYFFNKRAIILLNSWTNVLLAVLMFALYSQCKYGNTYHYFLTMSLISTTVISLGKKSQNTLYLK